MLSTRLTHRVLQAGFAAAVLGSAFLFACGSDETTPRTPVETGGAAQSSTGNANSTGNSTGQATTDSTDGQGGSGNSPGETKSTTTASTAQGGTTSGNTSSGAADAPACAATVRSNTDCVTGTDLPCSRDDGRICTCVEDAWSCPRTGGMGTGGAASTDPAAGGRTGGNSCSGVDSGEDCSEFGAGAECDRSDSAFNPRICTCGDNEEWTCVSLNEGSGGRSGSSETEAVAGRRGFESSTGGRRGFGSSAASASGGASEDTSAETATGARGNMRPDDTTTSADTE